jgi:hypothetical protein
MKTYFQRCSACDRIKPDLEMKVNNTCNECQRKYSRKHDASNKEKRAAQKYKNKTVRRHLAREVFGGVCNAKSCKKKLKVFNWRLVPHTELGHRLGVSYQLDYDILGANFRALCDNCYVTYLEDLLYATEPE